MQWILDGVRHFQERRRQNLDLYARLASSGQAPKVLLIGCADSRVPPEIITGAEPGDLFVTRNIANIVPPYGTGETGIGAVVEYAVRHLHVERIVVCGHTDCGGIKALDAQLDLSHEPHIIRWLDHARPARTKVDAANLPPEEQHLATVRENVLLQLEHLRSYDPVRQAEGKQLTLEGWVYHLDSGQILVYDAPSGAWQPLVADLPPAAE